MRAALVFRVARRGSSRALKAADKQDRRRPPSRLRGAAEGG